MPSMQYCMFENTSMELEQCISAMEDADTIADLDMNQYEQAAFRSMWRLCKDFLAEQERLLNTEVEENVL